MFIWGKVYPTSYRKIKLNTDSYSNIYVHTNQIKPLYLLFSLAEQAPEHLIRFCGSTRREKVGKVCLEIPLIFYIKIKHSVDIN